MQAFSHYVRDTFLRMHHGFKTLLHLIFDDFTTIKPSRGIVWRAKHSSSNKSTGVSGINNYLATTFQKQRLPVPNSQFLMTDAIQHKAKQNVGVPKLEISHCLTSCLSVIARLFLILSRLRVDVISETMIGIGDDNAQCFMLNITIIHVSTRWRLICH